MIIRYIKIIMPIINVRYMFDNSKISEICQYFGDLQQKYIIKTARL